MIRSLLFGSCLGACMMVGTAWAQRDDSTIGGAFTQPLRDLGILRPEPDEALQRAATAPYGDAPTLPNGGLDCATVAGEIESLNAALGADLDAAAEVDSSLMAQARRGAGDAVVDAVGDLVGLPYRGIIRRLSGADRRDREMRDAVQAGMVRRAFLRGLSARECATPQVLAVVQAAPEPIVTVAEEGPALTDLELARQQLALANGEVPATEDMPVLPAAGAPDASLQAVAAAPAPVGF